VAPSSYTPIDPNVPRPLGLMFYDFDFRSDPPKPLFFDARLDGGVLKVPRLEEVLKQNGESP
jgi:CRISPR-associated protein Cas5d